MRCVIITGLSGAGRSMALKQLEDMGYFCVDNMPPQMIAGFIASCMDQESLQKVALVVDTRAGVFFSHIYEALAQLQHIGVSPDILYLETADDVLIRRYKETRRTHPMDRTNTANGIRIERNTLGRLRDMAHNVLDTSATTPGQLTELLWGLYAETAYKDAILPVVISFGFKNGIPLDADLVFDVRFLPNPFYNPELREHTGLEARVRDYVFAHAQTKEFMDKLVDMVLFLLPHYRREGKRQAVIAIGCTGGMHRSVAIAEELNARLIAQGLHTVIQHRDIKKDLQKA